MTQAGDDGQLKYFPGAKPTVDGLAILETLEIVSRSKFTMAEPRVGQLAPMGTIQMVTVHHTGFPQAWLVDGFSATARHLEEIRQLHCDSAGRNWADIAYHFAVDRRGRVWQLRDVRYQGAHVKNHNANNIGVVALGNFDLQQPPPMQSDALLALLEFMISAYGLSDITTHRQLADTPTSCPGANLQRLLDRHARNLKKRLQ